MAYKNPFAPIIARFFATAQAPNARWEMSSSPSNDIQGYPEDNPNSPLPGLLHIDSSQIQVTPPLYLYEVKLTPPRSALTTTASASNPMLRLVTHEATNKTSAELRADLVYLGDSGAGHALTMNNNNYAGFTSDDVIEIANPAAGGSTESWHNLPLVNGWGTFSGQTPQYRKTVDGTVFMRGITTGGAGAIATLPVGYRPTAQMDIALKSNNDANTMSWCRIAASGSISVISNVPGAAVWLTLATSFSSL